MMMKYLLEWVFMESQDMEDKKLTPQIKLFP